MWLSNLGLISHNVLEGHSLPWVGIKDVFAIVKNVSGIIKSTIAYRKREKRFIEIYKELAEMAPDLHVN